MTRSYFDSIAQAAAEIVAAEAMDITATVPTLPLAKQVQARTGCGIDAAKRHVARAIRLARHEHTTSPTWGGRRTPAGGRPRKMTPRNWMKEQLQLGNFIDDCLEVDCTNLAEAACQEFDLFGPPPNYEAPESLFDMAVEVAEWWDNAPG